MNIVIITGASRGIGKEMALQLDKKVNGIDEFWLIARNKENLEELAKSMNNRVRVVNIDLRDREDRRIIKHLLDEFKPKIKILVNAAGYGFFGNLVSMSEDDCEGMIELNCKALTLVTRYCIPYISPKGRIIQFVSAAAFVPQPNMAIYAATKSYVLSLSRALALELRGRKISVTSVCPGATNTDFLQIANKYGSEVALKKLLMYDPKKVAREAIRDSIARHELSVHGLAMKLFLLVSKITPDRLWTSMLYIITRR